MKRLGWVLPLVLVAAGCGDDTLPALPDLSVIGAVDFSGQTPPDFTGVTPPDFTGMVVDLTQPPPPPDLSTPPPPTPDLAVAPPDLTGLCGVPGAPCCNGSMCNGGGCCENAVCVGMPPGAAR